MLMLTKININLYLGISQDHHSFGMKRANMDDGYGGAVLHKIDKCVNLICLAIAC